MKFDELKLNPGCQIQLQISDDGGEVFKYGSRYVGCIQGKALLLALPRTPMGAPRLRVGHKLTVHVMLDNGICVFNSAITHSVTTPYPLLHMTVPVNVAFKEVRGATRVTVNHPVGVTNISELEEPHTKGIIADISVSGARLELSEAVGRVGDELEVLTDVQIGRLVRTLRVKSVIRSRIERSTKEIDHNLPAVYGIEFIEANEDVLLVLYAYVYGEMAAV